MNIEINKKINIFSSLFLGDKKPDLEFILEVFASIFSADIY